MSVKSALDQIMNRHESGKFVILEVTNNFVRATNTTVKDNSININEVILEPIEDDNLEEILDSINIPQGSKVIILSDQNKAITYPAWVSVTRNDVKKEIDSGELENIISQAVWKFLNHYQEKAIAELKTTEADVVLANIRILGVRINKHKVLNPIGFKANTIEFLIEQTFIDRDLFRLIESKVSPKSEIVFVSQIGIIESLAAINFYNSEDKFNLVRLLPKNALVLEINTKARFTENITDPLVTLKHIENFDRSNLLYNITKAFDIESETSSKIYDLYIENKTSNKMRLFLKDLIYETWRDFSKNIKKHLKSKSKNFLVSDYNVSEDCTKHEAPIFNSVDIKDIIQKAGFEYDDKDNLAVTTALAGLLGYHYSNREDELNKLAERRAKWLIP